MPGLTNTPPPFPSLTRLLLLVEVAVVMVDAVGEGDDDVE
jgi:hypothetical protein